jgi:hypothetical protein
MKDEAAHERGTIGNEREGSKGVVRQDAIKQLWKEANYHASSVP